MSHAAVMCKRSLLLASLVLASVLAMVGVAHGEGFGEIRRFGGPGTKVGSLTPTQVEGNGKAGILWTPQHVIGVDPKTNDVFVLEETEEAIEDQKNTKQFFRLQEFAEKGELLGSDEFEFKLAGEVERHSIDGIAVDPKTERLFFLLNEERPEGEGNQEGELLDETDPAATALYAFNTVPNAKKELEPVAEAVELKEKKYESTARVLAGPDTLKPDSQEPGVSLLEPHGITVDPATNEVLIAAHVDDTPCEEEEPGVLECERDAVGRPGDHYVLDRMNENGKSEKRYVEAGDVLKPASEEYPSAPSSPVVAVDGGSERTLALHKQEPKFGEVFGGLVEFPAGETGTPSQTRFSHTGGLESGLQEVEAELSGGAIGGSLTVDPEESATLFGLTTIENEEEAGNPERLFAIAESSAETLKPIGWSGGQRASATDSCALEPGRDEAEHIQIAAGSHGDVFVLVPEYLREPIGNEKKFPTNKAIIEFGPGGKGCPAASVEKISASVGGKETSSAQTNQKVTLSSFVKQGDALSTVWKVENEANTKVTTTEQLEDDQYQAPTLETSFTEADEYKITEEVKTDNLDTPSLTVSRTFKVTAKAEEPPRKPTITAQPVSTTVTEGGTASFHAAAEGNPSPTAQWEVSTNHGSTWSAVGGTADTLTIPSAVLADSGFEYRAVFTNASGKEASLPAVLTVTAPEVSGGGGGSVVGGGSTPPPPGGGGVLGNIAVAPTATTASASLLVSSSGAVSIKVTCVTGATTCIGTVTLKTLTAVSAAKGKKKAIITLVTGSFNITGGQAKTITVHLSKTARALLAKDHELRARATVASHDPLGEKATTTKVVTLRPAPAKHKH